MRYTGGCLCGAVRYEAEGEPVFAGHCNCADCRKASGSGFIPSWGFRAAPCALAAKPDSSSQRLQMGTTPCAIPARSAAGSCSVERSARPARTRSTPVPWMIRHPFGRASRSSPATARNGLSSRRGSRSRPETALGCKVSASVMTRRDRFRKMCACPGLKAEIAYTRI
jgi:hypothetical protein